MTRFRFRYWMADLISGGELTWANEFVHKIHHLSTETDGMRCETIEVLKRSRDDANSDYRSALGVIKHQQIALRQIAANVTPGANATVKRMGRIAEEALK